MAAQQELLIPGPGLQIEERPLNKENLRTLEEAGLPFGVVSEEFLLGAQLAVNWLSRDRTEEDPVEIQLSDGMDLVRLYVAVNLAVAQMVREEQQGDNEDIPTAGLSNEEYLNI